MSEIGLQGIQMRSILKHRGITLIELMITLVVLVVLISLAAPQMGQFVDQRRLVGAAQAVYSHLQLARTEAVKQSRNMFLSIDEGTGTDWCMGFTDDTSGCDCTEATVIGTAPCTILADSDTVRVLARITADPFTNVTMLNPPTVTISIDYVRGIIEPVDTHTTTLQSARGRELQVSIGPLGRTRICSPTGTANVPGYPEC
jgi:type IV fimbrial biogenesis protein FimT